jgi:hypothetical protein
VWALQKAFPSRAGEGKVGRKKRRLQSLDISHTCHQKVKKGSENPENGVIKES